MIVVGYQVDVDLLMDSRGGACWVTGNICTILDFLLETPGDPEAVYKVAWDVDELAIPILQLLPDDLLRRLAETESCDIYTTDQTGASRRYRIWYPRADGIGQAFAITNKTDREQATIWHLRNFIPAGVEPPHNAEECEAYARKVLRVFSKGLGFQPTPAKLYSPVNVVKPYIESMNLPRLAQLNEKVANYAAKCLRPPWVEALKIGYWERAWDWDQNAAYANALAVLPDWRLGKWKQGPYQEKAALGYVRCDYEIFPEVTCHPIIEDAPGGGRAAVGVHRDRYLTKGQIDFIRQWKIGTVDVIDGVWWFPERIVQPMKTTVARLVRQRGELAMAGDAVLAGYLAKRVLAGLWGYIARWDWKAGKEPDPLFNPVWAAEITTLIPMRNADLIYRRKLMKSVISVTVDGFLCDKNPGGIEAGWKLSGEGPALVLSASQSWFGDKRPDGKTLPEVLALVKAAPGNNSWGWTFQRTATLGDCRLRGDYRILGQTITCNSSLKLEQDRNRVFPRLPRTGKGWLKTKYLSRPIAANGAG